jgi:hypothetical protein
VVVVMDLQGEAKSNGTGTAIPGPFARLEIGYGNGIVEVVLRFSGDGHG